MSDGIPTPPAVLPRGRDFSNFRLPLPRSAFTLVELLVVIAIIGMLAAIITPTVMGAVSAARDAAIKSEVEMLHTAIMKYKADYGELPPSDLSDKVAVRTHLLRLFPRINTVELNTAVNSWAGLSPAQSLVLWLTGYYDNPQFPLTNGGGGGSRTKLYDFDESRLYGVTQQSVDTGSGVRYWIETIVSRVNGDTVNGANYPVYVGPNCKGLPYVYFAAPYVVRYPAASNARFVPAYQVNASVGGGDRSVIAPYLSSTPPLDMSDLYELCNSDTFQIIAPGRDGNYGALITQTPLIVGTTGATLLGNDRAANQLILQQTAYPFSPSSPPMASGHQDNLTNFAQGPLKAASEKVLQ